MRNLNLIGPQVRKLRTQRGWTQEVLAAKLQMAGWDISRASLAKIEARLVWMADHRLYFFAKVFKVSIPELLPPIDPQDPNLHETVDYFMSRRF
jgi:transcriptional regulator with XRE-family HTH domain